MTIITLYPITPIGKPRMVRSDIWSGRKAVADYWAYKDALNILAKKNKFVLKNTLDIIFYLPMPEYWSKRKKEQKYAKPHDQKPDLDNLVKAFIDCLRTDDSEIYHVNMRKYWSKKGRIEIFE